MSEKRKLWKKNKTTKTSKRTRAGNGERKGVPRISRSAEQPWIRKKNQIAGSSISLSDYNSNEKW